MKVKTRKACLMESYQVPGNRPKVQKGVFKEEIRDVFYKICERDCEKGF